MGNILPLIGSFFLCFFGLLAIIKPMLVARIAGVIPEDKRGVSEIRAVYGGWILGLGAYAIWSQQEHVFYCLGFGWLMAALFRIVSFFLDKSHSRKNIRMVVYELFFALLFLLEI